MATTISTSETTSQARSAVRDWIARLEAWLERTGDRFNPILVKECRQALKGRQFLGTFALMLVGCWIWSFMGLARLGPAAGYGAASARDLFVGFYVILAFPLLVVVPHAAFRSLVDERDDRTFDLLAITTLGPRQIIAGKLGSAIVQMLVYLSAVSPCLAFTYLLRGIDAPTILVALVYTSLASILLSVFCLLVGTLAGERAWQLLASVIVIILLLGVFWFATRFAIEVLLPNHVSFDDRVFWVANFVFLLLYGSYVALFFLAASARLTFVSENRSTALRVVMFLQPIVLLFCIIWSVSDDLRDNGPSIWERMWMVLPVFFCMTAVHWYVMGAMMTGENPRLSNRAKRRLPQSTLGRAFLTWFNPGAGTGYLFAVSNLLAALAFVISGGLMARWLSPSSRWVSARGPFVNSPEICILIFGYVVFYLGLGKLLHGLIRRISPAGIGLGVALQGLLLLAGCVTPEVIDAIQAPHLYHYSAKYVSNPFLTFSNEQFIFGTGVPVELLIVLVAALGVFLLNVPGVVREMRQTHVNKPPRVAEEDAALAKMKPALPRNPWDE